MRRRRIKPQNRLSAALLKWVVRRRIQAHDILVIGLVLMGIITIVVLLFPVLMREREHQKTCMNQVRQLSAAATMYLQDHQHYPGTNWAEELLPYVDSKGIYRCSEDFPGDKSDPISYAFNVQLITVDHQGALPNQVTAPAEVGLLADSTPTRDWVDGGGLMGGAAVSGKYQCNARLDQNAVPYQRHGGINLSYCDGHCEFIRWDKQKPVWPVPRIIQAFDLGIAEGKVTNYGGGLLYLTCTPTRHAIAIGGDSAGMVLVAGAAQLWAAHGGKIKNLGFDSSSPASATFAQAKAMRHYAWLDASDSGEGIAIARDALVFIVAKKTQIKNLGKTVPSGGFDVSRATLSSIFFGTPGKVHAYTYASGSGSRTYIEHALGGTISSNAVAVADDFAMVKQVAADPLGIGYCSASVVDPTCVDVLTLDGVHPPETSEYRPEYPFTHAQIHVAYPLIRTLRLRTAGDGQRLSALMTSPEFQDHPLFDVCFLVPVNDGR